jgi:hypothetical protein
MMDELSNLPNREAHQDAPSRPSGAQPVTDREVPLVSATPFEAMHRWLDGEAREADALADPESARYVALWRRVGQETARRRTATVASPDVTDRIMAALPGRPQTAVRADRISAAVAAAAPVAAAPAPAAVAPEATAWWQRPVELNGATALAAAAGLVALGLLVGNAFRGQ